MKSITYIIIALTIFTACTKSTITKEEINQTKIELNKIMDQWHKNAAGAKLDAYINTMDTSGIYIGTDASEIWTRSEFKNFCQPFFDNGKTWNFKATVRNLYISDDGKTAWFDELLETHMGICRGSGVFQKSNDVWKIKHYVLSLCIPNEKMKEVKEIIGK